MGEKNGPRGLTPRQAGAVCFCGAAAAGDPAAAGALRADRGARGLALPPCCAAGAAAGGLAYAAAVRRGRAGGGPRLPHPPGPGPRPGRGAAFVYGLWLVFYAGFSLRSSASRFIYTIYPGAPPWPFVAAGLAAGLAAVLSPGRALARASELFRWLLLLALAPILLLGLADVDFGSLCPSIPRTPCPCWRARCPRWGPGPSSS